MIYATLALLSILAALVSRKDATLRAGLMTVVVVGVVFFSATSGANTDYRAYMQIYYRIPTLGDVLRGSAPAYVLEPGYRVLVLIFRSMSLPFPSFAAVLFACMFALRFAAYQRLGAYIPAAMAVYLAHELLTKDIGAIRHGLAAILVLESAIAYYGNRKRAFLLLVVLATSFHVVGIAGLLVPAWKRLVGEGMPRVLALWLVGGMVSFLALPMSQILLSSIPLLGNRFQGYLLNAEVATSTLLVVTKQILVTVWMKRTILRKQVRCLSENELLIWNLYTLSTFLYISFAPIATLSGRLGSLFNTVEPVLLSWTFQFTGSAKLLHYLAFLSLLAGLFAFNILTRNSATYVPFSAVTL